MSDIKFRIIDEELDTIEAELRVLHHRIDLIVRRLSIILKCSELDIE